MLSFVYDMANLLLHLLWYILKTEHFIQWLQNAHSSHWQMEYLPRQPILTWWAEMNRNITSVAVLPKAYLVYFGSQQHFTSNKSLAVSTQGRQEEKPRVLVLLWSFFNKSVLACTIDMKSLLSHNPLRKHYQ